MISFRCWYCDRRYSVAEHRIGERLQCGCKHRLRIPKRSGGRSRDRTLGESALEFTIYGLGGAVIGLVLGLIIVRFGVTRVGGRGIAVGVIAGLSLLGFLIGGLGGEAGIDWIGRKLRDRETGR